MLHSFTNSRLEGNQKLILLQHAGSRFLINLITISISFQIWRPVTALLFYPASFQLLINLFFLVNYSQLLENGEFAQKPADYAFMLLMNWTLCVIAGLFMNMMVIPLRVILRKGIAKLAYILGTTRSNGTQHSLRLV